MAAAFEVLAATQPKEGMGRIAEGRRLAILGDMLELGADEEDMHRSLASHPAVAAMHRVDCVGPRMKAMYEALPARKRGRWVETAEALAAEAHRLIDAGDVVLVKGSKGSRVSLVVDALRRLHQEMDEGNE
jgi:UDP-N-acetylmuramoyl-tripeptide--D-alanyl-D-alanine ligase